ncbi:MAG: hypothetical protein J6R79_01280 [Bacteroidaceae bacterium]|nr:hypothetical protein [Bacteroidaceae bacterium]
MELTQCTIDKENVSVVIRITNHSTEPYYRDILVILLEDVHNTGDLDEMEEQFLSGDIAPGQYKDFAVKFKSPKNDNRRAIYIGYYANHTDDDNSQLGDTQEFDTEVTSVTSIPVSTTTTPIFYSLDGTKVTTPQRSGIYIIDGKKVVR